VSTLQVQWLGLSDYVTTLGQQRSFTEQRGPSTPDQLWCLEHPPVYTQGLAGKAEHLLNSGQIPVVQTDRGGQVTYHGPGQLVMYPLLDLRRQGISIKKYVFLLEQSIITLLEQFELLAVRSPGAPGVYINNQKIAALGIRVRNGCCYHGLAVNVDLDMGPFAGINPCGYAGLGVTQLADFGIELSVEEVSHRLVPILAESLGYDSTADLPLRDRAKDGYQVA